MSIHTYIYIHVYDYMYVHVCRHRKRGCIYIYIRISRISLSITLYIYSIARRSRRVWQPAEDSWTHHMTNTTLNFHPILLRKQWTIWTANYGTYPTWSIFKSALEGAFLLFLALSKYKHWSSKKHNSWGKFSAIKFWPRLKGDFRKWIFSGRNQHNQAFLSHSVGSFFLAGTVFPRIRASSSCGTFSKLAWLGLFSMLGHENPDFFWNGDSHHRISISSTKHPSGFCSARLSWLSWQSCKSLRFPNVTLHTYQWGKLTPDNSKGATWFFTISHHIHGLLWNVWCLTWRETLDETCSCTSMNTWKQYKDHKNEENHLTCINQFMIRNDPF